MKKAITIRNVIKKKTENIVLDSISFDIYEGEIVGLVGEGKDILIKAMSGLCDIDSGDIYYYNYSLTKDFEKAMSIVSTVIENRDIYKRVNYQNNIELFKMMFKGVDENTIKEIIKIIQMERLLGRKFKTFSLGMEERINIASSLVNEPKILILDEPFIQLNSKELERTIEILKELKNTTIVIASNQLDILNIICTKIVFLNNGKIERIIIKDNPKKKIVTFEVDDFSKARLLIKDYCINEELSVYETDDKISQLNKELLLNNINVYRIYEDNSIIDKVLSNSNNEE